jgi:hypothetical protein
LLPSRTVVGRENLKSLSPPNRKGFLERLVVRVDVNQFPLRQSLYYVPKEGAHLESELTPVCQVFWLDVFESCKSTTRAIQRVMPTGVTVKEKPAEGVCQRWMEQIAQFHEFSPDAVGAGRREKPASTEVQRPRLSSRYLTSADIASLRLLESAPPQMNTGVQVAYPSRKDVYDHFQHDFNDSLAELETLTLNDAVEPEPAAAPASVAMSPTESDEDAHDPDSESAAKREEARLMVRESRRAHLSDILGNLKKAPSKTSFMSSWRRHHKHVFLRKHLRFAKCDSCIRFRDLIGDVKNVDEVRRRELRLHFRDHLGDIRRERTCYRTKRSESCQLDSETLSMIFDGADQSAYGFPYFHEASKRSSDIYKQRCHLIGVIAHGVGSWVYTMSERLAADSNLTIEVLQRVLIAVEKKRGRLPKRLCLQMDNCTRENKNKYVLGYLSWLVERGIFESIELSFLPVGHTHEDIDQMFSRIAVYLRGHNAFHQYDLAKAVKAAYTQNNGVCPEVGEIHSVANISGWLNSCKILDSIHGHSDRSILHYKIVPHASGAMLHTKRYSHHKWGTYDQDKLESTDDGFHLLNQAKAPRVVDAAPGAPGPGRVWDPPFLPPPIQPKNNSAVIQTMKDGLKALRFSESRIEGKDIDILEDNLVKLADLSEVPFQWEDGGMFLKELDLAYDGSRSAKQRALLALENQRYLIQAAALNVELDALDSDGTEKARQREITKRALAAQAKQGQPLLASEGGTLLHAPGLKAKKAQQVLAAAALEHEVDFLRRDDFVVIRNDDRGIDSRPFFLGRIMHIQHRKDDPNCLYGGIELQWCTPYMLRSGMHSKNIATDLYTSVYVPDFCTNNNQPSGANMGWASGKIMWYFRGWTAPDGGDEKIGGKLHSYVAQRIKDHLLGIASFQPLSLLDPVFVDSRAQAEEDEQNDRALLPPETGDSTAERARRFARREAPPAVTSFTATSSRPAATPASSSRGTSKNNGPTAPLAAAAASSSHAGKKRKPSQSAALALGVPKKARNQILNTN